MQEGERQITVVFNFSIPQTITIHDITTESGRLFHDALGGVSKGTKFPIYWGRTNENADIVVIVASKLARWQTASQCRPTLPDFPRL